MLTLVKTLNIMALMCKSLKSVGRAFLKLFKYLILYAQFSITGVLANDQVLLYAVVWIR